ncbi:NADPH-dependent aldehyde reductase Ahr [Winogradskya consettensis]|uniref:alcohol dehydrogenase (NADP(+)) n=1 Tax=Winogradskya consettensis TaxID=113560 RepID=A0A919VZ46_9ACTN|nr:NAD(P)-dependent alcohol dehydrogenase [Actinoplanes consettensis]GIM84376.1 alcohol dehydrogenase [Actinoplanes consettensis]
MLKYTVEKAGAAVQALESDAPPLKPREVEVAVSHCGVCLTDVNLIDDLYGITRFPFVAGHESIGVVTAVGADVDPRFVAVGQRVGVGAIGGSCETCEWCLSGQQNLCPDKDDLVGRGDGGAFASHVRASDWRHVQQIPEALPSAAAAPLLCAGSTVFPPLLRNGVRPTDRVAVVGVGGLGHLAIKFLAAWGCHVTAITSTAAKAEDARRFGAHEVIAGKDLTASSFDFVLSTAPGDLPWGDYVKALRPRGTLCFVGVPHAPVSFGGIDLMMGERRVVGGVVGTPVEVQLMLEFAARHGIVAEIETYPVAKIDDAIERVRRGDARYRVVLEM